MIEVTYNGPAGVYRIPTLDGEEYVLRRGVTLAVPDSVAESLVAVDGHDFQVGEEIEVRISDAARELAEEKGIDLSQIEGTGKGGAITKGDVEAAVEAAAEPGGVNG